MKKLEVSSFELRVAAFAVAVASSMTLPAATNDFYVGAAYEADATHFNTVQAAFNAVVKNSDDTTVIHLAPGTYREKVVLSDNSNNVLLLGDERRPQDYVISWNDCNSYRTLNGRFYAKVDGQFVADEYATTNEIEAVTLVGFEIQSKVSGFEARGVTFFNTAWVEYWNGQHGDVGPGQALAVRTNGNNPAVFRHCRLISGQDTFCIYGPAYCEDCYIEGAVDFLYGSKCALFNRCELYSNNGGYFTADGHGPGTVKIGYLFWKCRFNVAEGKSSSLGRPWNVGANVWLADCYLGPRVSEQMWSTWGAQEAGKTIYRDYGTRSPVMFTPPNGDGQWGEGIIVRGTMEEFWQEMEGFGFDSIDDIFSQEAGTWRPVMRNGIEIRE